MKTAISINDQLFKIAEIAAKKLGMTRSKLFSKAIEEYIEHHNKQNITEILNNTYNDNTGKLEQSIDLAQIASVDFGEW